MANFNPPHLYLSPPYWVIQFEFRRDLWCQKTRVLGLSCGIICVILRLAVLIQYRSVTDRETHRHTMTIYTTLALSRGKNVNITAIFMHSFTISTTYNDVKDDTVSNLAHVYCAIVDQESRICKVLKGKNCNCRRAVLVNLYGIETLHIRPI